MQNAGLLRRLAAILYDLLLVFACLAILAVIANAFVGWENVYAGGPIYVRAYNGARFLVIFGYFVGYWSYRGRTLGMQSWGLQLEISDGGRIPSLSQNTIRFFAAILSWLPLGLGFLWQLWDKERLAWHDRLSGTRIVHYPRQR